MDDIEIVEELEKMESIWQTITKPAFLIVYIVLIVVAMLLIAVSIMLNERRFNNVTKQLKDTVEEEKKKAQEKDDDKNKTISRFNMLNMIDEDDENYNESEFVDQVTLKEICEEFRLFAANRLGLFYDISVIREFIAGLAVSRIVILQGMSGTGKTSLAYAFGEFLENPSTIIPIQPMWKERTDLLGYYNEFTKRFNETLLLKKMYEANNRKRMYITILDEMNIARVEYYFAEFLSMLEIPNPESRYLEVVSDKWERDPVKLKDGRIKLPENMWFVGTANNDDSTFAISDKVYDRAMVLNLNRKFEPFEASSSKTMPLSARRFIALTNNIMRTGKISEINLERLKKLDNYLIKKFQISFGNRIMKQIKNYVPIYVSCGGDELTALDDILTKKILRKLETQNMAYLRNESDELCKFIDELFGEDKMVQCKEYICRMAKNV